MSDDMNPHIDRDGNKRWFLGNKYHREDGPAIEWNDGSKFWMIDGQHHREDGPAIEYGSGERHWYIDGKLLNVSSNEEFLKFMKWRLLW